MVRVKQTARTSLASVLVRFKTDSVSLRVLNNCTSDFSLQCRTHLYVPGRIISSTFAPLSCLLLERGDLQSDAWTAVSSRSQLLGRHVTFTYDPVCGRQLVVLQEISASTPAEQPSLARDTSIAGTMDSLARGNTTYKTAADTLCSLDEADLSNLQREGLLKKLSKHLGKGQDTGAAPSRATLASCLCICFASISCHWMQGSTLMRRQQRTMYSLHRGT